MNAIECYRPMTAACTAYSRNKKRRKRGVINSIQGEGWGQKKSFIEMRMLKLS